MNATRLIGLGILCETRERGLAVLRVLEQQYPGLHWPFGEKPTTFPLHEGAITFTICNQERGTPGSPACIRWSCQRHPGNSLGVLIDAVQFLQEPRTGTCTWLARAISARSTGEVQTLQQPSAPCPRCSGGFETLWPQGLVCPTCNYPGRLLRNRPSRCRHPRIRVTCDDPLRALCLTCDVPLVLDGPLVLQPRSGLERGFDAPCPYGVASKAQPRSVLLRAPDFLAEENPRSVPYLEEPCAAADGRCFPVVVSLEGRALA